MKKQILLILVCLFSLSQAFSDEGAMDGGGGMGVVCRDQNNQIQSVELLDLWEARVLYNRNIQTSDAPVKDQLFSAIERIKHSIDASSRYFVIDDIEYKGVEAFRLGLHSSSQMFLKERTGVLRLRGVDLKLTNDSFEEITPRDCVIEQLVRYKDSIQPRVLINQDLLDYMDNTNLAALYLHEIFYRYLRTYGERSSIRVRRSVGFVFEGNNFTPWMDFKQKNHYACRGQKSEAFVFQKLEDENIVTYIKITKANNRVLVGQGYELHLYYETPLHSLFDDRANSQSIFGEIGFDYNSSVELFRGGNDEAMARIRMDAAPDQVGPSVAEEIECKFITVED